MSTGSAEYLRVVGLSRGELRRLLVRGERPDAAALAGWEFRGANTPFTARLFRIRKFVKGFYTDDAGHVFGYNVPVRQGKLTDPWTALPDDAAPKRFGFFSVRPPDPESRDNAYLQALLLDYSEGENPARSVTKVLRDYLVRVESGSDDLMLGKAYAAFGPTTRIPIGFFVLERHRPTAYRPPPA